MYTTKKMLILIGCLTATSMTIMAQDFKTVLSAMKQKHESMQRFHVVMQVEAHENKTTKPFYRERFELKKDNENFLYRLSNNVVLLNEKHLIEVDKPGHSIVVNNRNENSGKSLARQVKFNLDSILSFYETPAYLGEKAGQYHYSLNLKKGAVTAMDMFVNKTTGLLSRIEYQYRDAQWVTIVFEVFDTAPLFAADTFADDQFVVQANGKLMPASSYKNFEIVKPTK
jgi:outer membrane lipoprotein-sorting protein